MSLIILAGALGYRTLALRATLRENLRALRAFVVKFIRALD
jgi:hypothetical protein